MRIRTVKPEFWTSESMGRVSREARLCFVGLWSMADDEGRSRAVSRMLANLLYPYDDDARGLVDGWLNELEREGCIQRYEVDGNHYLQVCNWLKHQKIDRPSKSKLPPLARIREDSRGLDVGSGIRDQGKDHGETCAATPPEWQPLLDPETIAGFIRALTTADPEPGMLPAWKACILDLKERNADPKAIIAALRNHRTTEPQYRPTLPDARFLKASWFTKLIEKTTARPHRIGDD